MVVQGIELLLDNVIPLPQVLNEFIMLIQQLTHQGPILLGLSFQTVSLTTPLSMMLNRSFQGNIPFDVRLLTLNYARGMRRRERGVKVQGATSCAGRRESLVVLEVRGRGWDK